MMVGMDRAPIDPETAAVREALRQAIESGSHVAVFVRGDPEKGVPIRSFEGRPVCFVPARDGRERVVIAIVEGTTEQVLLVDRICRVNFSVAS